MNAPQPIRHRNCRRTLVLTVLLGVAGQAATVTQPTNSPVRLDYNSFRLIPERNIFNPRRSGGSNPMPVEVRRGAVVERFALVGTMAYEKGMFAFFDSNSPEYRKVARREETIAGYKIAEINGQSVKLEAGTNTVELAVGMQMRREEQGPWQAVANTESFSSPPVGPAEDHSREDRSQEDRFRDDRRSRDRRSFDDRSRGGSDRASSASGTPASAPPSGADPSDVLKRLMEKRAEETK